jgi:hypothetical protein
MRPDKSRTLINRGTAEALYWGDKMIDYVIPIDKKIPPKVMNYLTNMALQLDQPFRFLTPKEKGYTMGAFGTPEFKEFVASQGMPD